MPENEKVVLLTIKKKTTTEWNNGGNPFVLALAELGYNTDTKELKLGDGITNYENLPPILNKTALVTLIEEKIASSGGGGSGNLNLLATKTDLSDLKDQLTTLINTKENGLKSTINEKVGEAKGELTNLINTKENAINGKIETTKQELTLNITNNSGTAIVKTQAEWENPNTPKLKEGQLGYDKTNNELRIGDGINPFYGIKLITTKNIGSLRYYNEKPLEFYYDMKDANKFGYYNWHLNPECGLVSLEEVRNNKIFVSCKEVVIDGFTFIEIPKIYVYFNIDEANQKFHVRLSHKKENENYILHYAFYNSTTGKELDKIYISKYQIGNFKINNNENFREITNFNFFINK